MLRDFDFTSDLAAGETISTKAVTAAVYSGADDAPEDTVSGAATSSGAIVTQKLIAPSSAGNIYEYVCQITTSLGQTLMKIGLMAVIPGEP